MEELKRLFVCARLEDESLSPAGLARMRAVIPRRRRGPAWAVAAALLLTAAGGLLLLRRDGTRPLPASRPGPEAVQAQGFPAGRLEGPRICLAPGAECLLEAGARVSSEPDGRSLRAESGRFWLEVAEGAPVTVALGTSSLVLRRGSIAVALPPMTKAGLMREALASDDARVWVLSGSVEVHGKAVPAGRKLTLSAEGWQEESLPGTETAALMEARARASSAMPGVDLIPPGFRLETSAWGDAPVPAAYSWVTVLEGRGASAEVRMTLGAAGGWYQWTAGLAARPAGGKETVEILWDGARLRGRVNGETVLLVAKEKLGAALLPAPRPAWGISVWSGALTVERSRLQEAR